MKFLLTKSYDQNRWLKLTKNILLLIIVFLMTLNIYPTQSTFAQTCPTALGPNNTIVSSNGLLSVTNAADAAIFSLNANDRCIIGAQAAITEAFRSYDEMKLRYFTNVRPDPSRIRKEVANGNIAQTNPNGSNSPYNNGLRFNSGSDWLYNVTGNYTVQADTKINNNMGVIFVDGDLTITSNLTEARNNNDGFIFVVGRNVNIHESVSELNAFFITFGRFCSGWTGGADCLGDGPPQTNTEPTLTLKGSLISLSSDTANAPKFVRHHAQARTTPAELFQYQPKYMTLSKQVFSADRIIWTEVP